MVAAPEWIAAGEKEGRRSRGVRSCARSPREGERNGPIERPSSGLGSFQSLLPIEGDTSLRELGSQERQCVRLVIRRRRPSPDAGV